MAEYGINKSELIDKHRIHLGDLYDPAERAAFEDRLASFTASDPSIPRIVAVENDELVYDSESYIPAVVDPNKHSLVMVLGNPAPGSVALGAMFAYENHGTRYHRFWRVLDTADILHFGQDPDTLDPHAKMERLLNGDYDSPFNLFIVPFYSLPTPPGGEWSGVAGIKRLFGRAFPSIAERDKENILSLFDAHLRDNDTVLVFQKDAYTALSESQEVPRAYDYHRLLQQPTTSSFRTRTGAVADLVCMLPTRLLHSRQTKDILSSLALNQELPKI